MEQHIFYTLIDFRNCHKKDVAIFDVNEVNLQQKPFGFIEQKCVLEYCKEGQIRKYFKITFVFDIKNCSVYLFRTLHLLPLVVSFAYIS